MNSLRLSRNGRLLMPILALLLMNVPVTEAKLDLSEGTKETVSLIGWILLTIATSSALIGTMVHLYRALFGHGTIPSEEETSRRLRESEAWLSYIAWIRVGLPTDRSSERAAEARVLDLERQFFEVPPPPSPFFCGLFSCLFPSKLFSCLFGAVKNGFTALTSGGKLVNEYSRRNNGKAPELRHIPQPQSSIAHGAGPSGISTTHETESTITEHGGESETHGSTSSNQIAENISGSAQQHVLAPPTKAHKAASSKHAEGSRGPAASHHGHVTYALDPNRPAHKPLATSKHVKIPTGPAASHRGQIISPIAATYALDPIRPARKPIASPKHVEIPIKGSAASHHHSHVISPIAETYALDPIRPAHKPLASSKHVEVPIKGPAASHHYSHVVSPIAETYALDPIRPAHKPVTSSKHVEVPIKGPTASHHHSHVISPIAETYALDPIRPVHKPLASSRRVESPNKEPAASHRHSHVISPIAATYALDPIRPVRKPLASSKHLESPTKGPSASHHHSHVISPIAAIYALDPIRPVRKPLPSSSTRPYPYHA